MTPLATRVAPDSTVRRICDLAAQWQIDPLLSLKIHHMANELPFEIYIISGYRTKEQQDGYRRDPKMTAAPDELSTHRSCPATGADLRPGIAITNAVKVTIGVAAVKAGLRWGGGAPVDQHGIPVGDEWRHVDLGPRK